MSNRNSLGCSCLPALACMHHASTMVSAAPEHGKCCCAQRGWLLQCHAQLPTGLPAVAAHLQIHIRDVAPQRCALPLCLRKSEVHRRVGHPTAQQHGFMQVCLVAQNDCAVYEDGRVCISILHSPGDDPHGYEKAYERWSPVHTVRAALAPRCPSLACSSMWWEQGWRTHLAVPSCPLGHADSSCTGVSCHAPCMPHRAQCHGLRIPHDVHTSSGDARAAPHCRWRQS